MKTLTHWFSSLRTRALIFTFRALRSSEQQRSASVLTPPQSLHPGNRWQIVPRQTFWHGQSSDGARHPPSSSASDDIRNACSDTNQAPVQRKRPCTSSRSQLPFESEWKAGASWCASQAASNLDPAWMQIRWGLQFLASSLGMHWLNWIVRRLLFPGVVLREVRKSLMKSPKVKS